MGNGNVVVAAVRCPVGAPIPSSNPVFSIATWSSESNECDPSVPPVMVELLTAPLNKCRSYPSHDKSLLNGMYYKILGCSAGTSTNSTEIALDWCGDFGCSQVGHRGARCNTACLVTVTPHALLLCALTVATRSCPARPSDGIPCSASPSRTRKARASRTRTSRSRQALWRRSSAPT